MSGVACSTRCMTHEACWQLVLSTSTGTSLGITDASVFFIALMMRDSRRGKPTLRSNDLMAWRIYLLLAILMIVFAFAHVLALQKLNAMQSARPASVDVLAD